jgi:hypothetical protein
MPGQNVKGKNRSEVLPQTQAFAAQELLNRGWGRPAQAVTGEGGTKPKVTSTSLANRHCLRAWRAAKRRFLKSVTP